MKTEVVVAPKAFGVVPNRRSHSADTIARVVELLQKGEPAALPTETVYGLAADALCPIAVAKIFEAKERPRFDPLIVHLPDHAWLDRSEVTVDRLLVAGAHDAAGVNRWCDCWPRHRRSSNQRASGFASIRAFDEPTSSAIV